MKNTIKHLISLCVLCAGFVLCRFVLFAMHGMRDWPVVLFVAGLAVLTVSFFTKRTWLPFFTSFGYSAAFALGALFQTDGVDPGGGRTNTLWVIWTTAFLCLILLGCIAEWISAKKKHKSKA